MSHSVIPAVEFDQWVYNWKNKEHETGPYDFFAQKGRVQTGMIFAFDEMRYLLSATGIVTVKIRFGLRESEDGQAPQFNLVLFGADMDNQVITPYFTSSAVTYHDSDSTKPQPEGNLPQALMREWQKNWHEQAKAGTVDQEMFKVRYGFLQGYNYPVNEFMAALGTFKGVSTIHITYGLHKYYTLYETAESPLSFVHTFGLVLYASTKAIGGPDGDVGAPNPIIDDSGYYDLTAPCPQTC
ncbi:hypothetical protein [Hymenobacter sp. IS2118]|uniref:hypothetical protein n=1 Tax=Hymenobacter sp. IS2118 TaxID=1505605 RepID=UPI0005511266|nr:hypothetical protein [Hymenobacter sp. IS2118]